MEDAFPFAPFIEGLPEVDTPVEGLKGRLMAGPRGQVAFFRAERDLEVPEHAHRAQWGIVVSGRLEFTVEGGEPRVYGPGETYRVAEGQRHRARLAAGTCIVDVFEEQRFRERGA